MRERRESRSRMFVVEAMEVTAEATKVERGVSEGCEDMGGRVSLKFDELKCGRTMNNSSRIF